ncbi:hypothetical protein HF086_008341 [Spodoptera exigua]|uniref:Uncharacterized protein n=1 Tax=Spodoptera exigua TaxID=7107 RepID=A0A922M3N7_SPOEX|nr:hypothetical protein HF086_008341 [Spodoptera exigua]
MFNQYRIPRENLLNRTADVTEDGIYESSFSDPSKILGAALENLSAGRIGIMQESCHSIASAVAIAIRYAATRAQFGERDNEISLIEYELHQWRLFGYVAAAVVFRMYIENFSRVYLNIVEKSNAGLKVDNLCSNLGDIRSNHEATVTYEGDNNVLSQQTGNWLLRQFDAARNGGTVDSPLNTVTFLKDWERCLAVRFRCRTTDELKTREFITSTYRWLICWLLKETHEKYESEIAKGLSKFEARARSQVYKWRELTKSYAEYLAIIFFLESMDKKEDGLKPVLHKLFCLYGLWSLDQHLGESLARLLREAILELCGDLKGEVVSIVDALAPTDFVLNSVLGKSDGKLYQNIQKAFFSHPGAFERAPWWREVVTLPRSKI